MALGDHSLASLPLAGQVELGGGPSFNPALAANANILIGGFAPMFKKNTAVTGFPFGLVSATDGSAITTGTVTAYYTLDGGSQGTVTASPVHEGNGQWSVDLTAGEMNGDVVGLLFVHASAINASFTIRTDTKIVSELQDLTAANVNAEVDTALADYDAPTKAELDSGLAGLNDLSAAQVNAEVDTALADYDGPTNTEMAAAFTEIKGVTFSGSTDSLEAIRDRGDAAWTTGAGGSAPTVEDIRAEMDSNSTQLAAIISDTNELQTDWANGGRLDLLIDAIKVVTDALPNSGALTDLATAAALATTEGKVDAIDAVVDAILVDTGSTLPGAISAVPTAIENADALLNRDMSAVSDTNARTPLNAFRFLRNKYSVAGTTLTVTKEDDSTSAWSATLTTDAAADPVTGSDPA